MTLALSQRDRTPTPVLSTWQWLDPTQTPPPSLLPLYNSNNNV